MARFNLILLVIAIVCALGTVASQHRARKLFVDLEKEQQRSKQLEVEFGQLQLEASTWAMHTRIEKIASQKLKMSTPPTGRIQVLVDNEQGAPK